MDNETWKIKIVKLNMNDGEQKEKKGKRKIGNSKVKNTL